jgi:hypothetical protein
MTPKQTLDWLAEQHKSQCNEDRPVQEWIRSMKSMLPEPVQEPVATSKQSLQVEQLLKDMLDTLPYNTPEYWMGRIKEVLPINTTPPAAQRQCEDDK